LTDFGLDSSTFNGSHYQCPFHDEKKPSLYLNLPDSKYGWFYCFGCGVCGDLVHWVAKRTNQSSPGAYIMIRQFYDLGPDEILSTAKPEQLRGKVRLGGKRTPSLAELETIAQRGSWDLTALRILAARGELVIVPRYRFKEVYHQAYALLDPLNRLALLRRLDGSLWNDTQKALLAKWSNLGVPFGVHLIEGFDLVTFAEGGTDYFRSLSRITEDGRADSILPLMMPSARAKKINSYILSFFRLKRVRIFAHNDPPGIAAAKSWKAQLQKVRAEVDLWIPPRIALPDGQFTSDLNGT
jgi:hypothetical protein